MKNPLLLLSFFTLFIGTTKAQDFVRKQEFQLSLDMQHGIRALNAYYKLNFKSNQDKFWRAKIGVASDDYYQRSKDLIYNTSKNIAAIGVEKRIPPTKNSQLFGGVEIYGVRETIRGHIPDSLVFVIPKTEILELGIGVPVGIVFNKTSKWYVGLELVPSLYYRTTTKDDFKLSPNPGKSWGYTINGFALCFGYRIPTKRI